MANKSSILLKIFAVLLLSLVAMNIPIPIHKWSTCNCDDYGGSLENMMGFQVVSDFFIALAYFSIPLELLYFISFMEECPFWWVVAQFGAFIVLCGLTHLVSMWTYAPHTFNIMMLQTILKVLTALVSCATAISLVHMIPVLLHFKAREVFLQNKANELNREVDLIKRQEEVGRHVRLLTRAIRSSLDRHTILTIMVEQLGKTLLLENCTIWMPDAEGKALELTHELKRRALQVPVFIDADDVFVKSVQNSTKVVMVPPDSLLGESSSHASAVLGAMVAVRLPLLRFSNFIVGGAHKRVDNTYAVMVLGLSHSSGRTWGPNELSIIETVADQVAVALSHAAILEESHRIQDQLASQNTALQLVRQNAETAVQARNEFLVVMNHEMRIPLHSIRALTSLLQESNLDCEQRAVVETAAKSTGLLCNIINDTLDYSKLEDGSLNLDLKPFDLPAMFREAANFSIPMAQGKGIKFSMDIATDVPKYVIGDEKRLLQVTLNLMGNCIKVTNQGTVAVMVTVDSKDEVPLESPHDVWHPLVRVEGFVFLRVVIMYTAANFVGRDAFLKLVPTRNCGPREHDGNELQFAICGKIMKLMHGHVWAENGHSGFGSTVSYVVCLQMLPVSAAIPQEEPVYKDELKGLKVLVTDDNLINRTVTKQLLEKLGCQATVVESGRQCLATLAQPGSMFRLLLLDVWMPEMDGYEVALRIQKNIHPERRPLVVALTADTDKRTQQRCLDVGMDGIILKPS